MKNISRLWILIAFGLATSYIDTDVVEAELVDERVSINVQILSLGLGDQFELMAEFFDQFGQKQEGNIDWISSNEQVISIVDGVANALMEGQVTITAFYNGALDSFDLTVSDETVLVNQRTGAFRGLSGYAVSGGFILTGEEGNLQLTFQENFAAANGPGLFVFLSNNEGNVTGGFEVGRLMNNRGEQTYLIQEEGIDLTTFDHVLFFCKPFSVPFGTGEFSN